MATWPMAVVGSDGSRLSLGEALGPGGRQVEGLLARLSAHDGPCRVEVERLARRTPAGTLDLPVRALGLADAVEAAAGVDPAWLAAAEQCRAAPRGALASAERDHDLEAALHVAMLLGAERLDPADDADVAAHVASGAMLWILGGAVAWALAEKSGSPFAPWASLVVQGWWPVGPSGGRLAVARSSPLCVDCT